jgi:hypothetical protein
MRTSRFITRLELGLVILGLIAVVGGACPASAASAADGSSARPADAAAYWHLGDPDEPFAPEECVQIRGGEHCMSFSPGWIRVGYRWLGDEPMYVKVRVGMSSVPSPGCDPGTPVFTTPALLLQPRSSITLHQPAGGVANWSGTALQSDEDGRDLAVRSFACEYGPIER